MSIERDSITAARDTVYQARLAKYRHDSARIDSIAKVARLDPILRSDSLFAVYRRALRSEGVSIADANLLFCLESGLTIRYGLAAKDRVVAEVRDTVYRDRGIRDALNYFMSRAPDQGVIESKHCPDEPVVHPSEVGGTSLDVEPRPPRLP